MSDQDGSIIFNGALTEWRQLRSPKLASGKLETNALKYGERLGQKGIVKVDCTEGSRKPS